jgi:nicotinamidase/pyrazinamidase
LGVAEGDAIIPGINRWIEAATNRGAHVFASRDWHPANHISFKERGGPWPPHCVQGTNGAEFHADLRLPANTVIISKATHPDRDSYSAFGETPLADELRRVHARRLWIAGLALDYCVKETAIDARKLGYEVHVIADATRAVNAQAGHGDRALQQMRDAGVIIERGRDPVPLASASNPR